MNFHGQLSLSEFQSFKRALNSGSAPVAPFLIIPIIIVMLIAFPPQAVREQRYVDAVAETVRNPIALFGLLVIALFLLSRWVGFLQRKREAKEQVGFFAERTLRITDRGIEESRSGRETVFRWHAFDRFSTTDSWVIMHPRDSDCPIVFFSSHWAQGDTDWEDALLCIGEYVSRIE